MTDIPPPTILLPTSMAHVALASPHAFNDSIAAMKPGIPQIEMLPNPDFVFPRSDPVGASHGRQKSMNFSASLSRPAGHSHRRGASALPSFTFNAKDTSGLSGSDAPEQEAQLSHLQVTPSRGTHKRHTSEFVGGKGMASAIVSSSTPSSALDIPPRRHRPQHSRSNWTLSSQNLDSLSLPLEAQPRLSSSLPNTPLEYPVNEATPTKEGSSFVHEMWSHTLDDSPARPPSRPRVGFADIVEYIPRPLSTISSDTGSSMSTIRGHSVNNSMSSVITITSPSPPSARVRVRAPILETTLEDEPRSGPRTSIDVSRRIEKEGQWLRTGSVAIDEPRSLSEPSTPFAEPIDGDDPRQQPARPTLFKRRQSSIYGSTCDRRKSEPSMYTHVVGISRLSALSLQEQGLVAPYCFAPPPAEPDCRSSSRKLKDWAVSKLSRKSREPAKTIPIHVPLTPAVRPESVGSIGEPVEAETDLDAVFGLDVDLVPANNDHVRPTYEPSVPMLSANTSSVSGDTEEFATMLDLDAALGPLRTPHFGEQRPRRELHSSRGTKDFVGPGGHYLPPPYHRRTESAPMLTPFTETEAGTPPLAPMDDVCEEDEEEVEKERSQLRERMSTQSTADDEAQVGVEIVDLDISASSSTMSLDLDDGSIVQHADWELEERSTSSYGIGTGTGRLTIPLVDRRSSVIEDTILEEPGTADLAIVEFDEEPRTSSLTKSSDRSVTPTVPASESNPSPRQVSQQLLSATGSDPSSALATHDFVRRQSSFDTCRIGTSASSIADIRTMSSCTTGEVANDACVSVDDVPSLTSSRSTMISTMHANSSRRDVSGLRTPSVRSGTLDIGTGSEQRRRKRTSIHSLSQLVGGSFGSRAAFTANSRPQTANDLDKGHKKKEHRLKKFMFWKSKHRQASSATIT